MRLPKFARTVLRCIDLPSRMNHDTKKAVCFGLIGLIVTGLLYVGVIIPMHELGHATICMNRGHFPALTFDGRVGIKCDGIEPPLEPYYMMGGIFGVVAALFLYGIGWLIRIPQMLFAAVILTIEEICIAIVETIAHGEYIHNPLTALVCAVPIVYVGFMLVMYRRNSHVARLLRTG